jgi:hypothetical protein
VVSELRSSGAEEDAAGRSRSLEIRFSSVEITFFGAALAEIHFAQGRRAWQRLRGADAGQQVTGSAGASHPSYGRAA